jgi:hypothetical protein
MFLQRCPVALQSYEVHNFGSITYVISEYMILKELQTLRLSGTCSLYDNTMSSLRHLILDRSDPRGLLGQVPLHKCFPNSQLESFAHIDPGSCILQEQHLLSLADHKIGARLRKLVLLGCDEFDTAVLSTCLPQFVMLEYFALAFFAGDKLHDFISGLSPSVSVLKLMIETVTWSPEVSEDETAICEALERNVLQRSVPPSVVWVSFGDAMMAADGRAQRWEAMARAARIHLRMDKWRWSEAF